MYAIGFRYYFTPLPGYFSPFPHGTCPLSVTKEYLGLTGGPARFMRNFRGSALLGVTLTSGRLTCTGVSPSMLQLPSMLPLHQPFLTRRPVNSPIQTAPQPRMRNACQLSHTYGLASSAFARHYSRNHCCFLFLWVLRCFTSPRSLQLPYIFRQRLPDMTPVTSRFPYSEIPGSKLDYQLPRAYRRSPRPSSALGAKASTDCT